MPDSFCWLVGVGVVLKIMHSQCMSSSATSLWSFLVLIKVVWKERNRELTEQGSVRW